MRRFDGGGPGPAALVAVVLLAVLAGVAIADAVAGGPVMRRLAAQLGLPLFSRPVVAVVDGATPRIEVREGTATVGDIAQAAADDGHADLVRRTDAAWMVLADIRVLAGARLDVRDVAIRSTHGIESDGGGIELHAAEVTGWDPALAGGGGPDTDPSDGRAWLAARGGGQLRITDSHLRHLGADDAGRTGVAWLGVGSGGRLSGSALTDVYTVAVHEARDVRIDRTVVRDSVRDGVQQTGGGPVALDALSIVDPGRDGIRLEEARGGAVTGTVVTRATDAGIAILDDSVGVSVRDSEVHDGRGTGILIHDTQGITLRDNVVYDNVLGVVVEGAAVRSELTDNRVAANAEEGVFVRNGAEGTVVSGNHIDRNGRAGLALVGADVAVTSNVLDQNADGIRLDARRSTGTITDNRITDNVEDGVDLPENDTLTVRGNLIAGNRNGAFSVLTSGRSDPVAATNTLRDNGDGQERIREE